MQPRAEQREHRRQERRAAQPDELGRASPPTSVPPSWAITIGTRTVALTRPSWRSPTRAWRTETSVTSNTVTAVSPISCWPMRQAIATSGRPAARAGSAGCRAPRTGATRRRRGPRPNRRTARSASTAPEQRSEPAQGGDDADRPPDRGAGRRSRTGATWRRTRPTSPRGPSCPRRAPRRTGSRTTSRRPSRISSQDRLAVGDAGGGGGSGRRIEPSSSADTRKDRASMAIAIGAVSRLTRKPAMPNGDELHRRAASPPARRCRARARSARRRSAGRRGRRRRRTWSARRRAPTR